MPSAGLLRAIIRGRLAGGCNFATSFSVDIGAGQTQDTVNAAVNQIAQLTNTQFLSNVRNLYPTTTVFDDVRGYYYGVGGNSATIISESAITDGAGTAAGSANMNQACLVATLLTGAPGRSNRGRMFLPAPQAALLNAGQLPGTQVTAFCTGVQTLFTQLDAFTAPQIGVVVYSDVRNAMRKCTQVRVDSRLDVMRSRADGQDITMSSTRAVA